MSWQGSKDVTRKTAKSSSGTMAIVGITGN